MRSTVCTNSGILTILCALTLGLNSCTTTIQSSKVSLLTANYCTPNIKYTAEHLPARLPEGDSIAVRRVLSNHDFLLSSNLGLVPHISQYLSAKNDVERVLAKQHILEKYLHFNTELEAIAAELDCNGERIERLASYLEKRNDRRQSRLTVASIVLGSATALASIAFDTNPTNNVINIAGEVGTAVLGFTALKTPQTKVQMQIERNMLEAIWKEKNQKMVYPPSLWRLLNEKKMSNTQGKSLIQSIRARWMRYGLDEEEDIPELEALYFKRGGVYRAEQLRNLATMHNELESSIRGITQDMRSLIQTITALDQWSAS